MMKITGVDPVTACGSGPREISTEKITLCEFQIQPQGSRRPQTPSPVFPLGVLKEHVIFVDIYAGTLCANMMS